MLKCYTVLTIVVNSSIIADRILLVIEPYRSIYYMSRCMQIS